MKETQIQHQIVIDYLCKREDEGGLGYRQTAPNIVRNDLLIPSDLVEFIRKAVPRVWSNLLSSYHNDETLLQHDLCETIRQKYVEAPNAAIFFNRNKNLKFKDETIPLFYSSGSELKGDEDFKKNIFSVVEESAHNITYNNRKLYSFRPDLSFFLNGIFIGYLELKSTLMGQNARIDGRKKVLKDYLSAIKAVVNTQDVDAKVLDEKKSLLAIFEKSIHLVTSDCNEVYVFRNIVNHYDGARQRLMGQDSIDNISEDMMSPFKLYPVSKPTLTARQKFEEVMSALYSKRMIEKEILYYNVVEYKYTKDKDGKTRSNHHTGRLISPRPKQKFGCDKIMNRIVEMLNHEKEPDYYINKLRVQLMGLGIPIEKIEEIILKRESYCNNKFVYSLLMQYAAGFGKSKIIGWTALQLKDFRYEGAYAYDKIMLVVDRLQLRDQLDTTMMNMNIDKSMFIEATDKQTFIDALDSNRRIIVVNIQKFLDLQQAIDESGTKLKSMRVAFLIDEIHRSNSGESNKEMINLFERLQESFNVRGEVAVKKNLLIGFTATPSDETLIRFGEFRSATVIPLWVPFDSYTMKEAIADGFVLDPTKHIIPFAVPVRFELPDDFDEDNPKNVGQSKAKVYEFKPRMEKIAEFVVDRLVSLVYGKIRGEGKAMLAVSSVPIALEYFKIIRRLYDEKCQSPLYVKYKDAPVAIVYSDSQKYDTCSSMNDGKTEDTVIQDFKNAKNGLIIVVDKLQTGFDEPKLHTLFLDKEIRDINAIQTISRVNRTCKNKNECHVIDCSWHNVNTSNIKAAFKKYCDMVVSTFNPEEEVRQTVENYFALRTQMLFMKWFDEFKSKNEDLDFLEEMQEDFRQWISQCMAKELAEKKYNEEHKLKPGDSNYKKSENEARALRTLIGRYCSSIELLRNIYDLDAKYYDETFLLFWHYYCNVYKDLAKKNPHEGSIYEVVESDEPSGVLPKNDPVPPEPGTRPKISVDTEPKTPKEKSLDDILEILSKLNEQEAITARLAQVWLKEIGKMFQFIKENKKTNIQAVLLDDQFSDEQKFSNYVKLQNKYRRSLRNRPDLGDPALFEQMLEDNEAQLYATFLADILNSGEETPDFDYDTTTDDEGDETAPLSMEELIAKVKKMLRPDYDEPALKSAVVEQYCRHFSNVISYVGYPFTEVVDCMFEVLNVPTKDSLNMGDLVKEALNILCRGEQLDLMDKRKNLVVLLLKYEVYLKKLYYVIHGRELLARADNKEAALADSILAFSSLRGLRHNPKPEFHEFSEKLEMLRALRNKESHGAISISETEVDAVIRLVVDMYLFVTAFSIAELRNERSENIDTTLRRVSYHLMADPVQESTQVAEPALSNDSVEACKLGVLKKSLIKLKGYTTSQTEFNKVRHWIAVYRIAVDEGLVIDKDFNYFVDKIKLMKLEDVPNLPSVDDFQRNVQGVYALDFIDWSNDGLVGRKLSEYIDIKKVAHLFKEIVLKIKSQSHDLD